jgi:hypothetical protein
VGTPGETIREEKSPITGITLRYFYGAAGQVDCEFIYPEGYEDEDYDPYWDEDEEDEDY